jgi:hypothetical protein
VLSKLLNEKRTGISFHRVFGIRIIRSRENDRAEDVVRLGKMRKEYEVLIGKLSTKRSL